jgi:hypothetical protein
MSAPSHGYDQAKALIDQCLKRFDTQAEAAKFGNTASGAFVKEVKLGMTPAEVEAALGLPETSSTGFGWDVRGSTCLCSPRRIVD